MTSVAVPICIGCAHRIGTLVNPACLAFPDGIPKPILTSEADHRQPFEGDRGIRFEPKTEDDAKYARQLFGISSTTG